MNVDDKPAVDGNGYSVPVDLTQLNFDRPPKTIAQENADLKAEIFKMHDRIDSLKGLVRKYTQKTDEAVGPLFEKKRLSALKQIDKLVAEVR